MPRQWCLLSKWVARLVVNCVRKTKKVVCSLVLAFSGQNDYKNRYPMLVFGKLLQKVTIYDWKAMKKKQSFSHMTVSLFIRIYDSEVSICLSVSGTWIKSSGEKKRTMESTKTTCSPGNNFAGRFPVIQRRCQDHIPKGELLRRIHHQKDYREPWWQDRVICTLKAATKNQDKVLVGWPW